MREYIDIIMVNPEIKEYPEYPNFARRVEEIDSRLKQMLSDEVLHPNDTQWWTRHPLRYAGSEYVDDVRSIYGVEVEVKP